MKKIVFKRDLTSPSGVTSARRVSTDVLNALNQWLADVSERSFRLLADEGDIIRVEVCWLSDDLSAEDLLFSSLIQHGIGIKQD
jgi:hypothetical protein